MPHFLSIGLFLLQKGTIRIRTACYWEDFNLAFTRVKSVADINRLDEIADILYLDGDFTIIEWELALCACLYKKEMITNNLQND